MDLLTRINEFPHEFADDSLVRHSSSGSARPELFTTSRPRPTQKLGSARAVASSEAAAARKEILAARKHRNRLSAAAHRERKNNHIMELEGLVEELREQNRFLKEALAASQQTPNAQVCSSVSPIQKSISPPAVCARLKSFQQRRRIF